MTQPAFFKSINDFITVRLYSRRTIDSYLYWIKYFIVLKDKQHHSKLGDADIELFLTWLAVERNVAASTQSVALNAIVVLKKTFLNQPVGNLSAFSRSSRQTKLPVVLTKEKVSALLGQVCGVPKLLVSLLYGSGLRRIELVRLRVKDIDFDMCQIQVWNGKGGKHRLVTLAPELIHSLRIQANSFLPMTVPLPVIQGFGCPMPWHASIPTHRTNPVGNICFPLPDWPSILSLANCGGTILMKVR